MNASDPHVKTVAVKFGPRPFTSTLAKLDQ